MGLGLDPTQLGSLVNTLGPEGVKSLLMAQQDQQQQELSQQAEQAARASQAAASNYQAAAQAPASQVGPAAFIPTLFSNVASVLGGTPDYRRQNAERLSAQQNDLMEARRSNLLALRDIQEQKAQAAMKLGDHAVAEKARLTSERLSKTLGEIHDAQLRQQKLDDMEAQRKFIHGENEANRLNARIIAETNALSREKTAGIRASGGLGGGAGPQSLDDVVASVASGQSSLRDYKPELRPTIITKLASAKTKILPQNIRTTLATLSSAKAIAKRIRALSSNLNQSGPGMNVVTGLAKYGGRLSQQNTDAVVLNRMVNAFLTTLSRATGERGTLTNQDVARAKGLVPNIFDTKKTTEELNNELDNFLQEMEDRAISVGTSVLPQQRTGGARKAPAGGEEDLPADPNDPFYNTPAEEDSTDNDPMGLY